MPDLAPLPELERIRAELARLGYELQVGAVQLWRFGDSAAMADSLAELVRSGVKTATASALGAYEVDGDPLPRSGDVSVVLFADGRVAVVLETLDVLQRPFMEVDAEFASAEGEGDLSLAYWRREHMDFFKREGAELGYEVNDRMTVVCERFRVLFAPAG